MVPIISFLVGVVILSLAIKKKLFSPTQTWRMADHVSALLCVRSLRGRVQDATQTFTAAHLPGMRFNSLSSDMGHSFIASRVCCCTDEGDAEVFIVWTHCVSAVELLQKGVVCAFGEATFLVDKSQHAQFLKGETDGGKRVKLIAVMTELVAIPGSLY